MSFRHKQVKSVVESMEIIQRQSINVINKRKSLSHHRFALKVTPQKKHSYNTNRKCTNKYKNVKHFSFSDNKRVHYIILTETRMISVSVNTWGISHWSCTFILLSFNICKTINNDLHSLTRSLCLKYGNLYIKSQSPTCYTVILRVFEICCQRWDTQ